MSDIFREVEEDVRRERLEKIWKEYGDYIVAAISVLILAAAAYRLWLVYETREAARASERYLAAQQLLQAGQAKAAAEQFARLAQTAPAGYAKLSQMQEADALAASGNTAAALANYRKLVDSNDELLSSVARIRTAWILVDGVPKSEIESMLGALAVETSPWRPVAQEILAYADYHAGDSKHAQREFKALSKDVKAPAGVRGRSGAMATFLGAGGAQNFGKPLYPEIPGTLLPGSKAAPQAMGESNKLQSAPPSAPSNAPSAAVRSATPPKGNTAPVPAGTPKGQSSK